MNHSLKITVLNWNRQA